LSCGNFFPVIPIVICPLGAYSTTEGVTIMLKKISAIGFALVTTFATIPAVYAIEGDLKDLRPDVNKKEWQLVKNDTTRSIKTSLYTTKNYFELKRP
jgi:hypothetical protein